MDRPGDRTGETRYVAHPPQDAVIMEEKKVAEPLPELAYHLYASQFQQLSWLAMAAAGGVLVMLQVGFFKARPVPAILATVIFALSAVVSTLGPLELVRGLTEGKDVRTTVKRFVLAALFLFGAGTGLVIMGLVRSAFRAG
jgi:hypothetical protein